METIDEAIAVLEKIGVEGNGDSVFTQIKAAEKIGASGDLRGLAVLFKTVKVGDEWLVAAAARALGQIGSPAAIPHLLEGIDELHGLFDFFTKGTPMDAPHAAYATAALANEISQSVAACCRALAQIGDPSAVPGLIAALHDTRYSASPEAAAEALKQLGTPEALEAVRVWESAKAAAPSQ